MVPFAKNVRSRGVLVIEPEVLRNYLPRARQMSFNAEGFDAHQDARTVSVTTTRKPDGTIVVDESIAGGNWIQIKGVSDARADLVMQNVNKAMYQAAEALKFARQNPFERTGPGQAYRTSYAGRPDRMTIFLRLEKGAVTKWLAKVANEAARKSPYASDLPRVDVFIVGF